MATKYLDHGAYAAYAATPTWGVPQDGDGSATTASTTASTVSVVFTANATAASSTFTVCGVVFSAISGANSGLNFQVGGSLSVTLDNLVTQINACTTTVGAGVADNGTPQLRNLVFARKTGTDTLDVMSRHGSTQCNGATNVNWKATAANWTASTSLPASFTGGVGGCWGYLFNTATIWPQAIAIAGYSLLSPVKQYFGTLAAGDVVRIRSAKTITNSLNDHWTASAWGGVGTAASPLRFIVDDSTTWADGSNPVLLVNYNLTLNRNFTMPTFVSLLAKRYGDGSHGLKILNAAGSPAQMALLTGRAHEISGLHFESAGGAYIVPNDGSTAENELQYFRECKFVSGINNYYLAAPSSVSQLLLANFAECEFSNSGNAVANSGFFQVSSSSPRQFFYFDSCKFSNFVSGSRLFTTSSDSRDKLQAFFRSCDFGGVSVLGPNTGLAAYNTRQIAASSQYVNRDFFIDNMYGFVEWNSNRSMPYCNARLLDGTTGWSIHVIPSTTAGRNTRFAFIETPRVGKINSLADGVRTLTIEMAIHDSLSWNLSHISAVIDYIDTSGNRQVIDTYDYAGAALTVSTATWSSESAGKVTYVDGATQSHNKYKFSVATPTSIATNTEIGIVLRCHTTVADTTKGFFVDPEIQVV